MHDILRESKPSGGNPTPQPAPEGPRPRGRMRLPFEPRKSDAGQWSYDHRIGICVTLIVFLVIGISFVWGKIDLGRSAHEGTILVEFPEEKTPVELTPEQIRMLEASQDYFNDVRNLTSNQNAELNAQLQDEKGTDASEIYEQADGLEEQMRANREAYEEGLRRIEERSRRQNNSSEASSTVTNTKVEGLVTVSFSFDNPVRSSVKPVVPAYMCEGGGTVVIDATLDINGNVISATVNRASSTSDQCMQTTAVSAALGSRFNTDNSAPAKHRGTITYIFIPQ